MENNFEGRFTELLEHFEKKIVLDTLKTKKNRAVINSKKS